MASKAYDEVWMHHHRDKLLNIATWTGGLAPVTLVFLVLNAVYAVFKIYQIAVDATRYIPPDQWNTNGIALGTRPELIVRSILPVLLWAVIYMSLQSIGKVLPLLLDILDSLVEQVEQRLSG
ncbi:hypothetical protein ACFLZW_02020 [Chloroflexota bacterium]